MAMQNLPKTDYVELVRQLKVPPAAVFGAFADPALVSLWLRPSRDIRLDVLAYDFHHRGIYRFAYQVPGIPIMHVNGEFRLIDAPHAIVLSWNIEPPDIHAGIQSEVRIRILPTPMGSEIKIHHVRLDQDGAPARHAEGWEGALILLRQLLEEVEHGS